MLSWATHFVASPTWRTPITASEILLEADAQLPSNWTTPGPASEIVASPDGAVRIERDMDKRRRIVKSIPLPDNTTLMRFQANLHTDTSALDRFSWDWQAPVVLFLEVPEAKQRYPLSERPLFFKYNVQLDEVIELEMPQESIELSFLKPVNASWQLSKVSLSGVIEHPRYHESRYILAGLWLITLSIGIYRAWLRARLPTVLVVGVLAGVLGGVLASKDLVVKFFAILRNSMNSLGGDITSGQFSSLMQSGHIVLFAVLTLMVLVFHKRWNLLYTEVVIGMVVLAIATEALQRHVLGRSPDIQDFLLDIIGIALSLIVFVAMRGMYRLSRQLLRKPTEPR